MPIVDQHLQIEDPFVGTRLNGVALRAQAALGVGALPADFELVQMFVQCVTELHDCHLRQSQSGGQSPLPSPR
jgi:hypothetical protein